MANKTIRERIKKAGVKYWEVADVLQISCYTFSVRLRHELNTEEKAKIFTAIDKLVAERETA